MDGKYVLRSSGRVSYIFTVVITAALLYGAYYFYYLMPDYINIFIMAILSLAVLNIIVAYVRAQSHLLEITDSDLLLKEGIFNTKTILIPFNKIDNVRVERSLFDRIFGLGVLKIDSHGTNQVEICLKNVPNNHLENTLRLVKNEIKMM